MRPIVIVESPHRATTPERKKLHEQYLERCLAHCIARGFVPLASHKLYTKCLDDNVEAERNLGIELGYELYGAADRVYFCTDLGWSEGMKKAKDKCLEIGIPMYELKLNQLLH